MPDPPVVITGGSITIRLKPADFPGHQPEIRASNVRVTSVSVTDDKGKTHSIPCPSGSFTVTLNTD